MDRRKKLLLLLLMYKYMIIMFLGAHYLMLAQKKKNSRRWWVRPVNYRRDAQGMYNNLFQEIQNTDHEEFFAYTRMSVEQFKKLCDMLSPYLRKRSIRTPLSVQLRLAVTLEILARGTSTRTAAWCYRIGHSTAHKILKETCVAIWKALHKKCIPPLTTEAMVKISEEYFQRWQFVNCMGAMDGKHIEIQCPPGTGSQFYSVYKKRFSIILMAACDAKYRFTWVDIGDYGSQSDGAVWANTDFAKAIEAGEINFPPPKQLPNSDITLPYTFIGDEAFPLTTYMMRPYARRNMAFSDAERIFNYRLSRARRTIENAFGIMAARWRILRRALCCTPNTAEEIVKAIICLHNYLMEDGSTSNRLYCPASFVDTEDINGRIIEGNWRRDTYKGPCTDVGRLGSNNPTVAAHAQRDIIRDYFCSDDGQIPWQWQHALRSRFHVSEQ